MGEREGIPTEEQMAALRRLADEWRATIPVQESLVRECVETGWADAPEYFEPNLRRVRLESAALDAAISSLAALDRERAARERAEQRAGELEEACQAALGNLDHLTDVWGQEGITRTVQDKLRAAVGPPRRAEFIPYFNVLPAAARPGSGEGE